MSIKQKLLIITISLIGVHSILLGIFIYFNTNLFYQIFFNTEVNNLFFVKQSGLFLFLIGLFYLVPLKNLDKMSNVTVLIILSKICAVLFLLFNASFTPAPKMIYLAAIGDGLMAITLLFIYWMFKKQDGILA